MKKVFAFLLLFLFLLPAMALASPQQECLDRLTPHTAAVQAAGLYPSVYLAQAMLETGWCKSEAIQYNNFWGVKCRDDLCFSKDTWEVYNGQRWDGPKLFQVFYSARAGTEAYCRKILYQYEYRNVDFASRDLFIDSMAKVWALDPDYAGKLKDIIRRYNLTKYDRRE